MNPLKAFEMGVRALREAKEEKIPAEGATIRMNHDSSEVFIEFTQDSLKFAFPSTAKGKPGDRHFDEKDLSKFAKDAKSLLAKHRAHLEHDLANLAKHHEGHPSGSTKY